MIAVKKAGFTIIEVMLFLGISGLLFLGVIIGTSGAINTQRYRDSVSSLQSLLQHQYSEVSNVVNENETNTCGGDTDINRGQSACVVLGRFLTTTDGYKIVVKNVIGEPILVAEDATNDVESLLQYDIKVTDVGATSYEVDWGAKIKDTLGNPKGFSMLILRSPLSGVVRTFLNDDQPPTNESDIESLLTQGAVGQLPDALKKSVELCVDPGSLSGDPKMSVLIGANSANESGIQILGESNQSKLGSSYICH